MHYRRDPGTSAFNGVSSNAYCYWCCCLHPAVSSLPAAGLLVRDAPGMSAVAGVSKVLGLIPASSDTVEFEGRQMIQY
jgi:hypothetical protein